MCSPKSSFIESVIGAPAKIFAAIGIGGKKIEDESIKIVNTSSPDSTKPGWYSWKIFLDAPEDVLSQIEHVKYILHPTFEEREIIKENRNEKFMLEQNGWGEFNVRVQILLKNGRELTKYH